MRDHLPNPSKLPEPKLAPIFIPAAYDKSQVEGNYDNTGRKTNPDHSIRDGHDQTIYNCHYSNVISQKSIDESIEIIENHEIRPGDAQEGDIDCDNVKIKNLYESFTVKYCLENPYLCQRIILAHKKIFSAFKAQPGYDDALKTWLSTPAYFPVSQKHKIDKRTQQDVFLHVIGALYMPEALLLSSGFMKHLALRFTSQSIVAIRDSFFSFIEEKVRGIRSNARERQRLPTKETQIGITKFAYKLLEPILTAIPWMHPGRSKCLTDIPDTQGRLHMYDHATLVHRISRICGISGSTNFWIWTALASDVKLREAEVAQLILSAYITLSADGGHNLTEVLSSVTLTAIYLRNMLTFAQNPKYRDVMNLIGIRRGSVWSPKPDSFATILFETTKNINPVGYLRDGDKPLTPQEFQRIGNQIYEGENLQLVRHDCERFFLHGRYHMMFCQTHDFLNRIPESKDVRKRALGSVIEYKKTKCDRSV
jgi:hypothetical protein